MFPIPQFTEGSLYILPCGKSVGEGGERGLIAYEKEIYNSGNDVVISLCCLQQQRGRATDQ